MSTIRKRRRNAAAVAPVDVDHIPRNMSDKVVQEQLNLEFTTIGIDELISKYHSLAPESGCLLTSDKKHGEDDSDDDAPFGLAKRTKLVPVDKEKLKKEHLEASEVLPTEIRLYNLARSRIVKPIYVLSDQVQVHDQAMACNALRNNIRFSLPCISAKRETECMREAFDIQTAKYGLLRMPRCANKEKCVGTTHYQQLGLDRPIIFMSLVKPNGPPGTDDSMAACTGVLGAERADPYHRNPQQCVLCHRILLESLVHAMRMMTEFNSCTSQEDRQRALSQNTARVYVQQSDPGVVYQCWYNKFGEEGEYDRNHMFHMDPDRDEAIIKPLVNDNIAALRPFKDFYGRWQFDQSALLYKPPAMPEPNNCESDVNARDLLTRDIRVTLSKPNTTDLLRIQPPSSPVSTSIVDRQRCEELVDSSGEGVYIACRIVDAARLLPRVLTTDRYVEVSKLDFSLGINSFTLSSRMRDAIGRTSFFFDISCVKTGDRRAAFLSKALPSRCQSRCFGSTLESRCFAPVYSRTKYDTNLTIRAGLLETGKRGKSLMRLNKDIDAFQDSLRVSDDMQDIIMCSLLGNYPHCTSHLNTATRMLLYPRHRDFGWYQPLAHRCPHLLLWCVRDYIVHAVNHSPGLIAHVKHVMPFDKFSQMTSDAMLIIRSVFNRDAPLPWTSLGKAIRRPSSAPSCKCKLPVCKTKLPKVKVKCLHQDWWLGHLSSMLGPISKQMNAINYCKPDASFTGFILSADTKQEDDKKTGRATLTPRPRAVVKDAYTDTALGRLKMHIANEGANETEQIKDVVAPWGKLRHALAINDAREERIAVSLAKEEDETFQYYYDYLTPIQFSELATLCDDVVGIRHSFYDLVKDWFHFFGVSDDAKQRILQMYEDHRDKNIIKKQRIRNAWLLRDEHPHAYNVLHFACLLYKDSESFRPSIVGYMSVETTRAQIRAAQAKWTSLGDGPIEATGVCLFYCLVCKEVHSNVRRHTSEPSNQYGIRNSWYSIDTGLSYCCNKKHSHRGRCDSTPLAKVNLVGIRFKFDGSVYQLCARCSCIMVPHPTNGRDWQEKGEMCSMCCQQVPEECVRVPLRSVTKRLMTAVKPRPPADKDGLVPFARCANCPAVIQTPRSAFICPGDVVICLNCKKPRTVNALARMDTTLGPGGAAELKVRVKALIAECWEGRRKTIRERKVRQQKPGMARNKRASRMQKA